MRCENHECQAEFNPDEEPGGLLFGPPFKFSWAIAPMTLKIHLCKKCTLELIDRLRPGKDLPWTT